MNTGRVRAPLVSQNHRYNSIQFAALKEYMTKIAQNYLKLFCASVLLFTTAFAVSACLQFGKSQVESMYKFGSLLPQNFKVYVQDDTVLNHPEPGFEERILPTYNHYTGEDGGYVAIYSRKEKGSVYGVGEGIYVIGQIRLKGKYIDRIFYPHGYQEGEDISQDGQIIGICEKYFANFKGELWIGGDTGGWFGIQ